MTSSLSSWDKNCKSEAEDRLLFHTCAFIDGFAFINSLCIYFLFREHHPRGSENLNKQKKLTKRSKSAHAVAQTMPGICQTVVFVDQYALTRATGLSAEVRGPRTAAFFECADGGPAGCADVTSADRGPRVVRTSADRGPRRDVNSMGCEYPCFCVNKTTFFYEI